MVLNIEDRNKYLNLVVSKDGEVQIFRNGVLIAFAVVELDLYEDCNYLSNLKVIEKGDRGRGLGKMLVTAVNSLIKKNSKVGELDVGVENVVAQRLYLSGGWRYVDKEEVDKDKERGLQVSYYKMEYRHEG